MLHAAGKNVIATNIMHLTCPQCQTEYEVPDAALTGRIRTLRCADCGATFKSPALPGETEIGPEAPEVTEPSSEGVAEAQIAPSPETVDPVMTQVAFTEVPAEVPAEVVEVPPPLAATRTTPPPPKTAAKPAQAPSRALGISILIVLLIIAAVLAEHRHIGHAWPPSQRLFNALGLH